MRPTTMDPTDKLAGLARKAAGSLGLRVSRVPRGVPGMEPSASLGTDPFSDMRHLIRTREAPVVIDAGANLGQSIDRFKAVFPHSEIHAFEPSPSTYAKLEGRARRYSDVHTSNSGLGSEPGIARLLENSSSDMSSFLRPGRLAWGRVTQESTVAVDTVDAYCARVGVPSVDILKIDTQGFDLEVVKGASKLIEAHRIQLLYMELIFGAMYENVPPCDEVLRHLRQCGLKLVCFYQFHFQENVASWSDALFIDPSFA